MSEVLHASRSVVDANRLSLEAKIAAAAERAENAQTAADTAVTRSAAALEASGAAKNAAAEAKDAADAATSATAAEAKRAKAAELDIAAQVSGVEGKLPNKADLIDGMVPASQLPSFVDDVLEYSSKSAFPETGESGKIYVAKDTNMTYRWSGSGYVEISHSLALGETIETAYRGDRGKIAYDHSQTSGNPHGTTGEDIPVSASDETKVSAALDGKLDDSGSDKLYGSLTVTDADKSSAVAGPENIISLSGAFIKVNRKNAYGSSTTKVGQGSVEVSSPSAGTTTYAIGSITSSKTGESTATLALPTASGTLALTTDYVAGLTDDGLAQVAASIGTDGSALQTAVDARDRVVGVLQSDGTELAISERKVTLPMIPSATKVLKDIVISNGFSSISVKIKTYSTVGDAFSFVFNDTEYKLGETIGGYTWSGSDADGFTFGNGSSSISFDKDGNSSQFGTTTTVTSTNLAEMASALTDAGLAAVFASSVCSQTVGSEKRYELYTPTVVDGVYTLKDFAINVITLTTSDAVTIKMPSYANTKARDFLVKINVTADTAPQVTFMKADTDADISVEASDDDWATLELGINYFSFTESER